MNFRTCLPILFLAYSTGVFSQEESQKYSSIAGGIGYTYGSFGIRYDRAIYQSWLISGIFGVAGYGIGARYDKCTTKLTVCPSISVYLNKNMWIGESGSIGLGVSYQFSQSWRAEIESHYLLYGRENTTVAKAPISLGVVRTFN